MKLSLLSIGLGLGAAAVVKPPTATGTTAPIGTKQVAESKAGRISNFIASMQNRVGRAEDRAVVAKQAANGNKLNRKERKAAKIAAKRDARVAVIGQDPEENEILSISASVSLEAVRKRTDHFSFSESEHLRDYTSSCSSSSSSSSGHGRCKKDKKKKEKRRKVPYRLRHTRVHCEESRCRRLSASASASASLDIGVDISAELSASAEISARRRTVLKVCEDELSRKKGHRGGEYYGASNGCYDPWIRVDYRKKVFYNDDAERRFSVSLSGSLSIEEEPAVTATLTDLAKPTSV